MPLKLTEVADERSLDSIGSPLSVGDGAVRLHLQSKNVCPLR